MKKKKSKKIYARIQVHAWMWAHWPSVDHGYPWCDIGVMPPLGGGLWWCIWSSMNWYRRFLHIDFEHALETYRTWKMLFAKQTTHEETLAELKDNFIVLIRSKDFRTLSPSQLLTSNYILPARYGTLHCPRRLLDKISRDPSVPKSNQLHVVDIFHFFHYRFEVYSLYSSITMGNFHEVLKLQLVNSQSQLVHL